MHFTACCILQSHLVVNENRPTQDLHKPIPVGSHNIAGCLQKSEDILTPEGVMEVWMLEAEHVPKMDFFGSGQPYGK